MRRHLAGLIAGGVGLAVAGALAERAAESEGGVVAVASGATAPAPAGAGELDRLIARFQERARADPYGAGDRASLAGLYLRRARETGSYADVLSAEEAARSSLRLRPERNGGTYAALSLSLMEQHRFVEARDAARKLVEAEPERPGARAHLGEIQMELGEYEAAAAIFGSLEAARADPDVAPRLARWLEITGRPEEARSLLYEARDAALGEWGASGERAAWYHLRVGDFELRHGRLGEAAKELAAGLVAFPGDYRLLAAMARLEAARGAWAESIRYGERVIGALLDPGVLIVMSDAALAAGDSAKAAEYARVLQVAVEGQQTAYHRDWGLFLLDRGLRVDGVAERARAELETRRDIYGYDLLAWAYHRQGRDLEALAAMRLALRTGARDALLLYHAGMIEHALGRHAAAERYLADALRVAPSFHPAHAATARAALREIRGPWYRRIGPGARASRGPDV